MTVRGGKTLAYATAVITETSGLSQGRAEIGCNLPCWEIVPWNRGLCRRCLDYMTPSLFLQNICKNISPPPALLHTEEESNNLKFNTCCWATSRITFFFFFEFISVIQLQNKEWIWGQALNQDEVSGYQALFLPSQRWGFHCLHFQNGFPIFETRSQEANLPRNCLCRIYIPF